MKYLILIIALIISLSSSSQVKIIFDTDFGGDADDLGALAMLNRFIDTGECDLLAVMIWKQELHAVPAVDAVNAFYKHPNIPIGVRKGGSFEADWNYTKPIADKFPHSLNQRNAPDAVVLYRQILSKADDNSIVIVPVGPLANIKNLLQSPADSISELTGKELLNQKVKEFVIMGGQFPEGENEWNFNGDMPGVTKYVLQNLSCPIIFSGFEVGVAIKSGEVFNEISPNTPLHVGFMHFSKNAPWIKQNFKGKILDNSTFDQTAVLFAVRNETGKLWSLSERGSCIPDDNGGNKWNANKNGNHNYLILKEDPEEIANYIENIMLHK